MSIYKLISVLLDYPSEDLLAHLDEIGQRLKAQEDLDGVHLERAGIFMAYLKSVDLLDLQAEYVQTFDLTPEHSLHLTHHLCGDDRNRGPALVELSELYRQHGLEMPDNELPDYVPLVLEFLHTLPPDEAHGFLTQAGHVLVRLAANLEKAGSPWQSLLRILADLSGCQDNLEQNRPAKETCQSTCGAMIDEEALP